MRKVTSGFENIFFLGLSLVLVTAAAATFLLRSRLHLHTDRVQYATQHLPFALLAACLFTLLVGGLRAFLLRRSNTGDLPTSYFLGALTVTFCLFWLPVLLAGGFVQDDWLLLAAASIRKIIYLHPAYSWYALDSVDGNFRPLGTVLYFGYMLKFFGLSARAFLVGNFIASFLGSIVAFFIVRTMGYSKFAAAASSALYMSRGVLYTIVSWASALSDDIAILFCGLMALAILKANRRRGLPAVAYHLLAWICFCVATLGKQSSFAAPLIVALLLFFRPGEGRVPPMARRILAAVAGLGIYAGTAAVPFFHAKTLMQATPYPIAFSMEAALRPFSYALWYFTFFDLPGNSPAVLTVPEYLGMIVVLILVVVIWRVPKLRGDRPKDVLFAVLASIASISLFVVLGTRIAPYYSTMAAFWMSIALGIALARFGAPVPSDRRARIACFAFCVLVVSGFLDVRLRQTALIPAGGYTWGTYGMDRERMQYAELQRLLLASPQKSVVVLQDFPGYPSYYTSMSLISAPQIQRILVYDSDKKAFFANDREGRRPVNELSALGDPLAYNWTNPLSTQEATKIAKPADTIWLQFRDGNIKALDSVP
ncbi:hypothetical protein [Granulicella arctica]|uniref:hypothetical protein n=1 Tax=Granulicella arctica TaxID=940613 RepID=UPI0021E05650|nr:hypothetical protein [Granulicella arctica]